MAIINYYEKYGISQTDELENIQWNINQKIIDEENDSFGEGHAEKMFILQSAKEAFATAESRAKYDRELADSRKKRDPDEDRKASFEKWYGDAKSYIKNNQHDLAKTAIDRAFQYAAPEVADCAFYACASDIYSLIGNYSQAIDYANQAIVLAPDNYVGYFAKMFALDRHMHDEDIRDEQMQEIYSQLKSAIKQMTEKAVVMDCPREAALGYGFLAKMHYSDADNRKFYPISENNSVLAEEYALKSVSLAKSPADPDAKFVLDDIELRRGKIYAMELSIARLRQELPEKIARLEQECSEEKARLVRENSDSIPVLEKEIAELKSQEDQLKKKIDSLWDKIGGKSKYRKSGTDYWSDALAKRVFYGKWLEDLIFEKIGCFWGPVLIGFMIGLWLLSGLFGFICLGCLLLARWLYCKKKNNTIKNINKTLSIIIEKERRHYDIEQEIRIKEGTLNSTKQLISVNNHDTYQISKTNERFSAEISRINQQFSAQCRNINQQIAVQNCGLSPKEKWEEEWREWRAADAADELSPPLLRSL